MVDLPDLKSHWYGPISVFLDEWLQSFTQYTCKNRICLYPISWHILYDFRFLEHYRGHWGSNCWTYFPLAIFLKLMHMAYQLITSGLKQFSGEFIRTCRFIIFKTHNLGFDLLMARRWNLPEICWEKIVKEISFWYFVSMSDQGYVPSLKSQHTTYETTLTSITRLSRNCHITGFFKKISNFSKTIYIFHYIASFPEQFVKFYSRIYLHII